MYSSKIWSLLRLLSILKEQASQFSGVGLFAGQKEIARHLLGDGGCPWRLPPQSGWHRLRAECRGNRCRRVDRNGHPGRQDGVFMIGGTS